MKILVLHPRNWIREKRKGLEVQHVSIGGDIPKRLSGEITYDGIGEKITREGLNELFSVTKRFKPDIFLFGIHFGLSGQMISALKDTVNCKTVMHYTDQRDGLPNEVNQYRDCLDLLLLSNQDESDHKKYHDIGLKTRTFYDGVSLDEYYPKTISAKYDCFFGGNNFQGLIEQYKKNGKKPPDGVQFKGGRFRQRFIKKVDEEFRLQVYGTWGWNNLNLNKPVRPMVFHPRYIDILREGKLILNTYNIGLKKLYTRRLFRALASGRPYVTQYIPGMEDDFKNGENIIWFKTVPEGIKKIRYYLENNGRRNKIGDNAVKLVYDKHTFGHRLDEFLKICNEEL